MSFASAPLGLIVLGLALGMRHATDPDHVVAVTAILTRERRFGGALRVGMVWGFGHSITVLAVGMAIIFLKVKVPARLGLSLEFMVAIVLILLGLRAVKDTLTLIAMRLGAALALDAIVVHSHSHTHRRRGGFGTHRHSHAHSVRDDHEPAMHDQFLSPGLVETISGSTTRSFIVGLIHGLAGSAAIALLVTAAIPSAVWAMVYLTIFCCGVMLGMVLITTALGVPLVLAAQRLIRVHHRLSTAAGWLSFAFGFFLTYQIGIVDQLFGAAPAWLPH
jgi:hypothetical protein